MTQAAITLQATCYTVQAGQIVQGTLADFDHFIETTTRPTGVGYKYYTTTRRLAIDHADDGTVIEDDVWVLAKWATWGGPEQVVRDFPTEAEALAAAEATYVHDILNNSEIAIHLDRASAEQELAQATEE